MPTTSCNPQEPLVRLDPNGQASILNYNLPQATCYQAISTIWIDFSPNSFKPFSLTDANPFWRNWAGKPIAEIEAALSKDLSLIANSQVIKSQVRQSKFRKNSVSDRNTSLTDAYSLLPYDKSYIAQKIKDGYMPFATVDFSGTLSLNFIPEPAAFRPRLGITLHFKMCSYLGDYGAGHTVKTFSLLPGEKTTITVKHYLSSQETRSRSENVLDSFSESSANDLQTTINNESQRTAGMSFGNEVSIGFSSLVDVHAGLKLTDKVLDLLDVSAKINLNANLKTTFNSYFQGQVKKLVNSVNSHTSSSNNERKIEVNNESSSTITTTDEETIVREISNINQSRVLNFVYRQLLQEYFTITYLDDVSITYEDGMGGFQSVKLGQLDILLNDVMRDAAAIVDAKNTLFASLCSFYDYTGTRTSFIEQVTEEVGSCIGNTATTQVSYIRKRNGLMQTYLGKSVPGIIFDVTHRVLRTPSLIVDALLGQGEALDCYNQKLQDAAAINAGLQNDKLTQAIRTLEEITDPAERARLYKKVFSECCDVPQSGCGCHGTESIDK